jgi:hypothetical protein
VNEAVAIQRGHLRYSGFVVTAAAALGVLAFVADLLAGAVGQVMVALTSSGFAWGLTAFLAGRVAPDRRRAIIGAAALLLVATLLYYLLVVFVSRRWSGAYLADGTSADTQGLVSIAIAATLWSLGSLVAGPLLGLLGHVVRAGTVLSGAMAAGFACGLLSGDGWHDFIVTSPWRMSADPQYADLVRAILISELTRIVPPLAILVWLTRVHRFWRAWPALVAATVASSGLSVLLWYGLRLATNRA